jgi:hypothetical protein
MKKGQGLSLNTIIIAAIVLIVLVVLWAIFTGRMGVFSKGMQEQEARAYTCICSNPSEPAQYCAAAMRKAADKDVVIPTECGGKWTDCIVPQKCFKET